MYEAGGQFMLIKLDGVGAVQIQLSVTWLGSDDRDQAACAR